MIAPDFAAFGLPELGAIHLAPPLVAEVQRLLLAHLHAHYQLYGEGTGVRSARKHIAWYTKGIAGSHTFRQQMNLLETAEGQFAAIDEFFSLQATHSLRLQYDNNNQSETEVLAA